jgi:hypothetical protein
MLAFGFYSTRVHADDSNDIVSAYQDAHTKLEQMSLTMKDDESVVAFMSDAVQQLDGHKEQFQNGLLTTDQAAYQYVIDYIYLIHELRLLPMFGYNDTTWTTRLSALETELLNNMHNFQSIGSPFALTEIIQMADYDTVEQALTKEAVVKASGTELEWHEETMQMDMRPTWIALVSVVGVLVIAGFLEIRTLFFSKHIRQFGRLLRSK